MGQISAALIFWWWMRQGFLQYKERGLVWQRHAWPAEALFSCQADWIQGEHSGHRIWTAKPFGSGH